MGYTELGKYNRKLYMTCGDIYKLREEIGFSFRYMFQFFFCILYIEHNRHVRMGKMVDVKNQLVMDNWFLLLW